jgi:hypothetical protein
MAEEVRWRRRGSPINHVILSVAATSQSEVAAKSKDPYTLQTQQPANSPPDHVAVARS